jgi:hypothetical protein
VRAEVGNSPYALAIGDFNGDGKPDLAIANSGDNTVTVLFGNGSGGFTAAAGSPFVVGAHPTSIAVGDFNGDGNLDLVTANAFDNTVTVLLGNGSGGLAPPPAHPLRPGTFRFRWPLRTSMAMASPISRSPTWAATLETRLTTP